MGGLGAPELIIILIIVFLLFGATRLPKLAKSLGQASTEFKKGVGEGEADDEPLSKKAERKAAKADDDKVTMTKAELDALLAEREANAREAKASEEKVTMTKAELDALLAERESRARRDAPPN
jgi:sec-independent protein translocase protein TatA